MTHKFQYIELKHDDTIYECPLMPWYYGIRSRVKGFEIKEKEFECEERPWMLQQKQKDGEIYYEASPKPKNLVWLRFDAPVHWAIVKKVIKQPVQLTLF